MKRRHFLAGTITATSMLTLLPYQLWAGSRKNSTLQLAQVGCGRMGRADMTNIMNQGWGDALNARVVACCDVDMKRTALAAKSVEAFYREKGEAKVDVKLYSDYRELLQRDDIDALIISTPENWHALIGVAAANRGMHMYVQKPLTYSIPEGRALVDAVRANKVILQTGSQQRSNIRFRQVCTIIRNDWLGKLKKIEVEVPTDEGRADGDPTPAPEGFDYDMWLGPCPYVPYVESRVHPEGGELDRPGWLQVERYSLGMITNWGAHMYDIAQWGADADEGGPTTIQATGEFPDRGHFDVHVGYQGEARYDSGVLMTSVSGVREMGRIRFITEDGWAVCGRGWMDCSDRDLLRRRPTGDEIQLYTSTNHYADFLQSVRDGTDPICPVEVGHHSNAVCVLHHISMKLGGRKLKWEPVNEKILDDPEANAMLKVSMREPYTL